MLGTVSQAGGEVSSTSSAFVLLGVVVIAMGFFVVFLAAMWKLFTKMGEPGWKGIVPVLNAYEIFRLDGREPWLVVLLFLPCVSVIGQWFMAESLGNLFGKSTAYKIGLFLFQPILVPVLAFGSSQYVGPRGPAAPPGATLPPAAPPPAAPPAWPQTPPPGPPTLPQA